MATISLFGIIIRFLLGGGAVVACTVISRKAGTKIGGIFAAFPAVFLAALLTLRLDMKGMDLIHQSIILSQGALVGMFINIICAMAVVYFCDRLGWKKGLSHSLIGWFIVSLGYAVFLG
ncbi:DUF3147 family protein [Caldifermentibacillus hisashii]|uniref:DUF3147 family protein n=1 Tax=Caldifermentibacillus hisashii TaxID=996558 RepID=UPI003100FCC4